MDKDSADFAKQPPNDMVSECAKGSSMRDILLQGTAGPRGIRKSDLYHAFRNVYASTTTWLGRNKSLKALALGARGVVARAPGG